MNIPGLGNSEPVVTVYIPVYNGQAYIAEAIASIEAQSFTNFECILIDDCSTDRSWEILQKVADKRFLAIRNPVNTHVATTANIAMHLAKGKYLARLDPDDIAAADRLQKQVEFMEAHPEIAVCGGQLRLFGDATGRTNMPLHDAQIKANFLCAAGNIANPASMARLEFLRAHKMGFDPRFPLSSDYGIWLDCMFAGAKFANLPDVVTHYRIHEHQGSNKTAEVRRGVRHARLELVGAWFPDLTYAERQLLEDFLPRGQQTFAKADALKAIALCERLMATARARASVHGEDRDVVLGILQHQVNIWREAIEQPQNSL